MRNLLSYLFTLSFALAATSAHAEVEFSATMVQSMPQGQPFTTKINVGKDAMRSETC